MSNPAPSTRLSTAALLTLPLLKLLVHLFTADGYGYFRDELYYLACSEHLDFGYVDHPPLSILLLWLIRNTLGTSRLALRLLPALAGACTVLLTGLMARRLGGRPFAQALAMTAALVAPLYLALDHFYSMNAFDLLVWALAAYLFIHILDGDDPRLWLVLGAVLGLGLQNKVSVLWLGFGLAAGLLATRERRRLLAPWPWLAGALSLFLFLPHLVWQIARGWPTLEFIANATGQKMAAVAPWELLLGQITNMHPLTLPIWLVGLWFYLGAERGRPFRPLGWVWVAVFALLALAGTSRAGYLAPAYTWLFAAGALVVEDLVERRRRVGLKPAVLAVLILAGVVTAPLALPVLPVETYIAYARRLGVEPSTDERKELAELPQFYADMHGWEEIVATVARVYESLPPDEQQKAAVFTLNYGVAGAVDLLGRKYRLPRALSSHNNYYLWGPRGASGDLVILVGGSRQRLAELFATVERAATIDCGYCMPYENRQPIWICRELGLPLAELWPELKHFD